MSPSGGSKLLPLQCAACFSSSFFLFRTVVIFFLTAVGLKVFSVLCDFGKQVSKTRWQHSSCPCGTAAAARRV